MIYQRPEPLATKKVVILTLTRIFLLTHDQPTLLREITTPAIAPFATSCLNNVTLRESREGGNVTDIYSSLLHSVLQSFIKLLPNHPSSFRPFITRIRTLLAPLLAPTFSSLPVTAEHQLKNSVPSRISTGLAQRLHALLPSCAARTGSSEEWSKYVHLLLDEMDRTANHVFRGVVESDAVEAVAAGSRGDANGYQDEISDTPENELLLPAWKGMLAGCERLVGLIQLLQAYLATKTSTSVSVPTGMIVNGLTRILQVFAPAYSQSKGIEMGFNPEVSREERDAMYSMLPELHNATLECYSTLMTRLSQSALSLVTEILDQISWSFQRTRTTPKSRAAFFDLSTQIIELVGPSFTPQHFEQLAPILCQTWMAFYQETQSKQRTEQTIEKSKAAKSVQSNEHPFTTNQYATIPKARKAPKRLIKSALKLMLASIAVLPAGMIPVSMRKEMDQTAVLLQDEQVLLASVLNPGVSRKGTHMESLLPFLSRMHPGSLGTEALLNPRLPPVRRRQEISDDGLSEDEEDMTSTFDQQGYNHTLQSTPQNEVFKSTSLNNANDAMTWEGPRERNHEKGNKDLQDTVSNINPLLESPKRSREPEMSEGEDFSTTTALEPDPKRPRLEPDDLPNPFVRTEEIAQDNTGPQAIVGVIDSPPPVAESSAMAQKADKNDSDSDGSFEIPPIISDSDTGAEEEEEDESDEDEEMNDNY